MLNSGQNDADNSELNFTAFTDLCRFCSLRTGPKINLFDKEAEQRQILYKIRSFLPIVVRLLLVVKMATGGQIDFVGENVLYNLCGFFRYLFLFRLIRTIFCRKKFANAVWYDSSNCLNGKIFAYRVIQFCGITLILCELLRLQLTFRLNSSIPPTNHPLSCCKQILYCVHFISLT